MRRALVITPLAVDVVSADAAHPSPAGRASEWVILDVVREEPLTGALHTDQEERRP